MRGIRRRERKVDRVTAIWKGERLIEDRHGKENLRHERDGDKGGEGGRCMQGVVRRPARLPHESSRVAAGCSSFPFPALAR